MCMVGLLVGCEGNEDTVDDGNSLNWSLFRGDASLSGYTDRSLPKKPSLLWSYKSGVRTVSSPIVHQGTTYWCDKKGHIWGIDLKGEPVFGYDLDTPVEAIPMVYDSVLYIGRLDGWMSAISLEARDTLWNFETMGQISASPNRVGFEGRKAIVFGSYDNYLYCVDERTGQEINRFESGYYLNGAVALWKKHVLFGGCDSWIRVINCKTGLQTDSLLMDSYVPASPAIMGDYVYVGDYAGNIYELYLEGGKIVRQRKILAATDEGGSFVSVPAITDNRLFVLSNDRYLYSIDRIDGTIKWKYMLKGKVGESSPVVCFDKVIVCTKTGIVSILDTESGDLKWEYDTGEQIVGSPAVIKDHFFILTAKGTLFCFGKGR